MCKYNEVKEKVDDYSFESSMVIKFNEDITKTIVFANELSYKNMIIKEWETEDRMTKEIFESLINEHKSTLRDKKLKKLLK